MATSLLAAAGLAELVGLSEREYEAKALQLLTDPIATASIVKRLLEATQQAPLFDKRAYA
jgi:predicted O-linked N-acetylglucosamine transferase (SPINDLY family)